MSLQPASAPAIQTKRAPRRPLDRTAKALLAAAAALLSAQLTVKILFASDPIASVGFECASALLTAAVCYVKARQPALRHERQSRQLLLSAFVILSAGGLLQLLAGYYPFVPHLSALSQSLGLFFALPLFFLASRSYKNLQHDPVAWFDTAEACILFLALYGLVYPASGHGLGMGGAGLIYQVQALALAGVMGLRFAATEPGMERSFYRAPVLFAASYAICSLLSHGGVEHGLIPADLADLGWTVPLSVFSIASLGCGRSSGYPAYRAHGGFASPSHMRGLGALALSLLALGSSAALGRHRPGLGGLAAATVLFLFAARTSIREWQLHTAHQGLEHTATHDSLTGLVNRARLKKDLAERLERDLPEDTQRTGLLFLDLDRFKTINDGLGHAFGDLLLIRVAELLEAAVRPQDEVARLGGDEFVILLDHVDASEAEELGERVVAALRAPLTIDGRLIHVTASIGVAVSYPGASSDAMLQTADCAMYKAKSGGKDRIEAFVPSLLTAAQEKLELETDLREALLRQAIEVHYHPIYNLPDLTIRGFEALVRWRHPRRGSILPLDLIEIAENAGLIAEVGRQVMRLACRECQAWNLRYGAPLRLAVNVSARQFALPGFLDEIATILRVSELPASLLKLDVTESVLLNGYQAAEQELSKARAMGMSICLDDFGTGYSSLSYLLHFPFDVIKIDPSFVRGLDLDERRAQVVRAVIALASTLNKRVIAEGVESISELDRLREFGCDMVQGFLFCSPLTAEQVDVLLTRVSAEGGPGWAAQIDIPPPTPASSPWGLDAEAVLATLPKLSGRSELPGGAVSR